MLATAMMLGEEVTIPWWVPEERIPEVTAALAAVTTTASTVEAHPLDAESNVIIGLDDFYAGNLNYTEFNGVDGSDSGIDDEDGEPEPFSIAIMDVGINDLNHPFFGPDDFNNETGQPGADGIADRIVVNLSFTDPDSPDGKPAGQANLGWDHGSNVASIAAGFGEVNGVLYSGVARGVNIVNLVFGYQAQGAERALQWIEANANNYNIIAVNMSIGLGPAVNEPDDDFSTLGLGDELKTLAAMDIIPVSAAGNSYFDPEYYGVLGLDYPAADPFSLAVGATYDYSDPSNQGIVLDGIGRFSNRHETALDVLAPGASITGATFNGGTSVISGTSQAAPHVSGAIALMQQVAMKAQEEGGLGRRLTFQEVQNFLRSTGPVITDVDPGAGGPDPDPDLDLVPNTGFSFRRLDIPALMRKILFPKVTSVQIRGNNLNDGTFSVPDGSDYTTQDPLAEGFLPIMPVGTGVQLLTVPVANADTIIVTFDRDVGNVLPTQVELREVLEQTTLEADDFQSVTYDSGSRTVEVKLNANLSAGQYQLKLSDTIGDPANNKGLDGDWSPPETIYDTGSSTFPSGDGVVNGDFVFHFTILPGDANRDNVVGFPDLAIMQLNFNQGGGFGFEDGDFDGDGIIKNQEDYVDFFRPNFTIVWTNWGYDFSLGDYQLDEDVDFDDIDVLVEILTSSLESYAETNGIDPQVLLAVGDIDGDGDIDFDEIALFVTILKGNELDLLPAALG